MICTTHTIDIPAGQLYAQHWHIDSPQAPIILLHDSLGSVALWRDFPEKLAQTTQRSVIAYDRLGFGQSSPHPDQLQPDFVLTEATNAFAAVLDYFQLQQFVVFGHSVGGGMAVGCAAAYPERCEGLIIESAQAFNETQTLEGIRLAQKSFQEPAQWQRLEKYHADQTAWVLSAWIDTWLSDAFADWHLDASAQQVQAPSLILHGEYDEYGSLAHPQRFAQHIQHSQVKILAGCHHVPHREQTAEVLQHIQAFCHNLQAVQG